MLPLMGRALPCTTLGSNMNTVFAFIMHAKLYDGNTIAVVRSVEKESIAFK
jgi:hypothetical protein